jgi:riboflavin kinase / FMN adenylyltransferase
MQIITDLTQFHTDTKTAVAIGKFDGLHLGHRRILREILNQTELSSCVVTFDPLPEVFFGSLTDGLLSTREEKRRAFDRAGVELLIELPFCREIAAMEPERFITEILQWRLHAGLVAAGPDLSYGDKGRGDFALLRKMQRKCGFTVKEIDKVEYQGSEISSTRIRSLIRAGKMEEAAGCLGAPYQILGTVLHGNAVGRTIGIPTVNQIPESDKLLPPRGVYYSLVHVDGRDYPGMTNIGSKPTVSRSGAVTVETHLYDYTGDLYGRVITTFLLSYRRGEQKFSGLPELQQTMERDLKAGREFHRI